MRCVILLVCLVVPVISSAVVSAQQPEKLRYTVIYSDSNDVTHFREEELRWEVQNSSDPRTRVLVTPFLDVQQVGFLRIPIGYSADWHPAPGKRFRHSAEGRQRN